ncbi:RHS repeat-associated core domain-containing protein [Acinetobacter junii]|uniref:RHS repeat-associated core domain-containing protein n=2 Tax=Acinetobacter TaxID=469 RepID=UPI00384C1EC2
MKNGQGQQLSFAYSTTQFGLPQITLTTPLGKFYYFLDRHHNLAQVVYPDGRRLKYSYDPKFQGGDIHNLTAKWVFDPDQKKFRLISQWQYDQQDRAILSQHANGVEKVTIQFDPRTTKAMPANYSANKPVFKNVVTNSLGQKTTYSYQVVGTQFQLLESFGAGCASCGEVNKRYRFNPQGLVAYAADLNSSGQVIRAIDLKYNDLGEVIARTVSGVGIQSQTTNYEYESYQVQQGNMADDLANASSPLLTQLNQQDYRRLKSESRASVVAGKQYRKEYQYNSNNQLISVKETGFSPLGDTLVRETRYGYDPQGRLSWEDGPLPNGPSNSPKDSDVITYAYDTKNQLISKISGGDQATYLTNYNQYGYAENITKKDGNRTLNYKVQYNPLLGIISSTRRLNKELPPDEKKYYFDPVSSKFTVGHNGKTQNISFNQSGYPELLTLSDKDKIHIHYDTENNKQSLDIYQSEYLIKNIPIVGKAAKKQTNNNAIINKDDFGNTVFEFNQSTGGIYTKYDSAGNILERIYQDGIHEKRTLDYIGRFIKSENNDDVILERQYNGTLLTLQKTKNEIKTWSYRSDGKILKEEKKIIPPSKLSQKQADIIWETKYSYNQDGSLNSEQTNNLTKHYDYRNNKLDKISIKSKNGQNLTFENLKFNTHNQLIHFTEKKNKIEFERKFDRYGNLLSQVYTNEVNKGFLNRTLVFLGLKKAEYQKEIKSYFYDEKGRLVYSNQNGGEYYRYTAQGMLKEVWDCHALSIQKKCQLKEGYDYDVNGNRISQSTQYERINYNYENSSELIGYFTKDTNDSLVHSQTLNEKWFSTFTPILPISYKDHFINDSIASFNQKVAIFNQQTYDHSGMPLGQNIHFDKNDYQQYNQYQNGIRTKEKFLLNTNQDQQSFERDYIYIGKLPVAQLITNNKEQYFDAIEVNRLNTPVRTYQNGVTKWSQDYDTFGNKISNNQNINIENFESQPLLRLPGQYEDVYNGTYQNGFRNYQPLLGRYTTRDPSGLPDGPNPYLYVNNDPLNKVDIYGLSLSSLQQYLADYLTNQSALLIDTNSFNTDELSDELLANIDLPDNAIGANTFDLIDKLFAEAKYCWQPNLQTRQIDYLFKGIQDGAEATFASLQNELNNPYSLGVESTFNSIEPRFITVAGTANSQTCKSTGCGVETYRLAAGTLDQKAAECNKNGDDLCILRILSAVYATQMRFAKTMETNTSLSFSQREQIRAYYSGVSGKIKFKNTDPALDSLAKIIAFTQVNCSNSWDSDCEKKWLAQNERQAKEAAILMGIAVAPAVIAVAPEIATISGTVGTRALQCLLNIICNTNATAVLDGVVTGGMATGTVGAAQKVIASKFTKEEIKSASQILKTLNPASKVTGQSILTTQYLATKRLSSIVEADAAKILEQATQLSNKKGKDLVNSIVAISRASYQGKIGNRWQNIILGTRDKNSDYHSPSYITANSILKLFNRSGKLVAQFPSFAKAIDKDHYTITNPALYISYIKTLYKMSDPNLILNPKMEKAILNYLKSNPTIEWKAGLPGLHAEVLATNEILNLFPKAKLKDIAAATYRVQKGNGQGEAFAACQNCCGVLVNVIILTGSTVGDVPACSL